MKKEKKIHDRRRKKQDEDPEKSYLKDMEKAWKKMFKRVTTTHEEPATSSAHTGPLIKNKEMMRSELNDKWQQPNEKWNRVMN